MVAFKTLQIFLVYGVVDLYMYNVIWLGWDVGGFVVVLSSVNSCLSNCTVQEFRVRELNDESVILVSRRVLSVLFNRWDNLLCVLCVWSVVYYVSLQFLWCRYIVVMAVVCLLMFWCCGCLFGTGFCGPSLSLDRTSGGCFSKGSVFLQTLIK